MKLRSSVSKVGIRLDVNNSKKRFHLTNLLLRNHFHLVPQNQASDLLKRDLCVSLLLPVHF